MARPLEPTRIGRYEVIRRIGMGGLTLGRSGNLARYNPAYRAVSAQAEASFVVAGACPSPIEGMEGNREFFLHLRTSGERMEQMLARIKESEGPPPGVPSTGIKVLFDEGQGTAVVLQDYATAEDLDTGAKFFEAMDPSAP